jgi:hypothetical protein
MITRGEELLVYLRDRLELEKGSLGLAYITVAGDRLTPEYPAAVISYDKTTREDHTTHYFLVQIYCDILLLHASLNESRQERTVSDLELVTRVVASLHSDRTLGGEVIHSYVPSEDAGVAETNNFTAIGTRLSFVAEQREAFK